MIYEHDLNARLSISNDLAKDFKEISIPFGELGEILKSNLNYSFFIYKDNYRKESNTKLKLSNCIALDFDDGLTIDEAKQIFKDYSYCLATTKSHQKEKHSKICDRFRLILPLEENINLNTKDFKFLLKKMILDLKADNACSDISRFFYAYEKSEVYFNCGKLFDLEDAFIKAKKQEQIRNEIKAQKDKRSPTIIFEGKKIETLRSISKTPYMLKVLKFSEKFFSGGRNNYLFSVAMYLRESGFSDDEVINEIFWINSQASDGISEDEIVNTIFKSMRIFDI